jgi:threonine dehydratase
MISRQNILDAHKLIKPYVRATPVLAATAGELHPSAEVFLKLELLQHTGSFKPRGAFNRMLANPIPPVGVVAASGGNHGIATAYAAGRLGCHAEIFVPEIASPAKVERLRTSGAGANVIGATYQEALNASNEYAARTGALIVHAYNQPETLAGQGTIGLELDEQIPQIDTVLIAAGGGGLLGGIAAWFDGRVRIVSVEPELSPCLARALEAGSPVDVSIAGIAADSLGASRCGALMFPIAQKYVTESVLVSDDDIRNAQRTLWNQFRLMAEPGGATAMAALLSGRYKVRNGERLVVLVCGANVTPGSF